MGFVCVCVHSTSGPKEKEKGTHSSREALYAQAMLLFDDKWMICFCLFFEIRILFDLNTNNNNEMTERQIIRNIRAKTT